MKTSLLGQISVNENTIFDNHLYLVIIPFLIAGTIYVFRNKIKSFTNGTKTMASNIIATALLVSFMLVFVENEGTSAYYGTKVFSKLFILNNLDLFASVVISFAIFTKRFGVVRMLIPSAIVLGLTKLINNPGQSITSVEIINNILLITAPILFVLFTNKNISVKAFAFSSFINIGMLVYVFILNKYTNSQFSTLSSSSLKNNYFYSIFDAELLKIFMFIFFTMIFETFVWVMIRFIFYKDNKFSTSFAASFKDELRAERLAIKSRAKNTKEYDFLNIEQFNSEAISEVKLQEQNENEQDMFENLFFEREDSEDKSLIPFSIIRTRNSQGTRAPSL